MKSADTLVKFRILRIITYHWCRRPCDAFSSFYTRQFTPRTAFLSPKIVRKIHTVSKLCASLVCSYLAIVDGAAGKPLNGDGELYQQRGASLFHPYFVQIRLPSDGIIPSWIWGYMAGLLALLGLLGYLALFLVWLAGFVGYCNTTARSTGPFKIFQQTCWTASKGLNSSILNFFLATAHKYNIPYPQSSKWLLFPTQHH